MPMPYHKEVKLEELSRYFHLPEKVVAKELGICLTSLKKLCRSYGISRWPFRKLKSLERTMRKVRAEQGGSAEAAPPQHQPQNNAASTRTGAAPADGDETAADTSPSNGERERDKESGKEEDDDDEAHEAGPHAAHTDNAAAAPRKRRAYSMGNKTVFLSDEERHIFQMTLGSHALGLVPDDTASDTAAAPQAAAPAASHQPPPLPHTSPGLRGISRLSPRPPRPSAADASALPASPYLSATGHPRSPYHTSTGHPPGISCSLPPLSLGSGAAPLHRPPASAAPGLNSINLGLALGPSPHLSPRLSPVLSPKAARGEFDAIVTDAQLTLHHWACLWSEHYLRLRLVEPLGGVGMTVSEDGLRVDIDFDSHATALRAQKICRAGAAASAAAAAATLSAGLASAGHRTAADAVRKGGRITSDPKPAATGRP